MMEAVTTSETSVSSYEDIRGNIPEDNCHSDFWQSGHNPLAPHALITTVAAKLRSIQVCLGTHVSRDRVCYFMTEMIIKAVGRLTEPFLLHLVQQ
jgi:hypothetical protein